MNTMINKIKTFVKGLMVLILMLSLNSCADNFIVPAPPSGATLLDIADGNADLDIMTAALIKTGLANSLSNNNSGGYTVFAPSDSAFTIYFQTALAQPAYTEDDVINFINTQMSTTSTVTIAQLVTRLNYHTFSSKVTSSMITGGQVFTTLQGARLSISKVGTDVLLNANIAGTGAGSGARVRTKDHVGSNGVIHTINKVLNPVATTNVLTAIGITGVNYGFNPPVITGGTTSDTNDNNYNLLAAAIRKTGLAPTLQPNQSPLPDFTVFAPRDGAMRAYILTLDAGAITEALAFNYINNLTGSALTSFTDVIKYHVVSARVLTTDLVSGQMTTLLPAKTFTVNVAGTITLTDQNTGTPDATVTVTNVLTNAGILHAIDGVLLPQ